MKCTCFIFWTSVLKKFQIYFLLNTCRLPKSLVKEAFISDESTDEGQEEAGREEIIESSERYSWPEDVMRHVTVSTDTRRCGVHSSVSSLTRWLQMAALQTLQCPRPSDCRLRQSSGLLQPCRHWGPIGDRVWSETGQWEAGYVKVGIPHPSVHPVLQIQTAERQPAALQWGGCRVLSRDWGSITDHLQPPALAWDRSMSSAFSLATDLGPLIGPPMLLTLMRPVFTKINIQHFSNDINP